jgi:hypothetical protein
MSKLTAVEWFANEIQTKHDKSFLEFYGSEITQAKAMERERLIDFARYCETEWNASEIPIDIIDAYLESN